MKNFFNYVLLALVTVCFALPLGGRAEAAKVAVVPLANHVAGNISVLFTCSKIEQGHTYNYYSIYLIHNTHFFGTLITNDLLSIFP